MVRPDCTFAPGGERVGYGVRHGSEKAGTLCSTGPRCGRERTRRLDPTFNSCLGGGAVSRSAAVIPPVSDVGFASSSPFRCREPEGASSLNRENPRVRSAAVRLVRTLSVRHSLAWGLPRFAVRAGGGGGACPPVRLSLLANEAVNQRLHAYSLASHAGR
jgi:hypothetical protein